MKLSRRAALAITGGFVALAGCQTDQTARMSDDEPSRSVSDSPSELSLDDHFNAEGELTAPVDTESVRTKSLVNRVHQFEFNNTPDRELISREPIELYLDPDGDDDGDGTESDPLKSIQEAFNRLPHIIQHKTRIQVAPGTYDEDGSVEGSDDPNPPGTAPHIINYRGPGNIFEMVGDPTAPSNVTITGTSQVNFAFMGGHAYRCVVRGIEFDAKVLNYDGVLALRNCILRGDESLGMNSAIDGYSGFTHIRDCTFAPPAAVGVYADFGHRVVLENCRGRLTEEIYRERRGGEVTYDDRNTVVGSFPDTFLADDFWDERLQNRITTTEGFRPEYGRVYGGATAENGHLVLPGRPEGRSGIQTDRGQFSTGTWELTFHVESPPSTGRFQFSLFGESVDHRLAISVGNDGTIELEKTERGAVSTLCAIPWGVDTNRHVVSAVRDPNVDGADKAGYKLQFDDDVQLAIDPFVPEPRMEIELSNSMDVDIHVHDIRLA